MLIRPCRRADEAHWKARRISAGRYDFVRMGPTGSSARILCQEVLAFLGSPRGAR
jgi:hypothetical protein